MQINSQSAATLESPADVKAGRCNTNAEMIQPRPVIQPKPIPINWHPGLSIYASEQFLKTAGDDYGWLGGFNEAGQLRCLLPYTIIRKSFLRLVRFRVATIPASTDFSSEEEREFLNSVVAHFRLQGASMIIPATANAIFRVSPDGASAAPYGTYIVDLTQPEDVLWNRLHSKHRNVVRNAMKHKVEIQTGLNQADQAFELVRDTLKRSDMKFMPRAEFDQLVQALGGQVRILVAYHNGVAQGCAVIPFSEYGAYYLYAGSVPNPFSGAMNLLNWEAIKMFKGLGVKRYDFVGVRINPEEGTKQHGLMRFKERFGGELVSGCLWKYRLNAISSLAYSAGVRILKGGDIVDQERHKRSSDASPENRPHNPGRADEP